MLLADKKTIQKLGSRMNDSAASKPSDFALRMMQKMGWKEGQGLGKNEDGIADHIVIKKRDDNVGLGLENTKAADAVAENWWHNSFSSSLAAFKVGLPGKSEKKKSKKDKKESKKDKKDTNKSDIKGNNDDNDPFAPPSYEELFRATGGKRLGMRARMDQKGKFLRTEQQPSASSSGSAKEETSAQLAEEEKKSSENSDATTEEEERKEKKSKKEKKEKRKSDDDRDEEEEKKERKESKKSKKNDDDSPKKKKKQKTSQ